MTNITTGCTPFSPQWTPATPVSPSSLPSPTDRMPRPRPSPITVIPEDATATDYRKKLEERFGKPLVQQYLDTYFSSYPREIQNNDELVFKLLGRLLRRNLNLHTIASQTTEKFAEIKENRIKLAPIEKELRKLNEKNTSYRVAKPRLIELYDQLGEIETVHRTKSRLASTHKIYSLAEDNPLVPASLLRKIGFIAAVIIKLFCRLILRQDNWNEIPATGIPQGKKLLLGSIPNSLSDDAETLSKNGVTAVLSFLEPFENEKRCLSQPYSREEWAKHGITQGWIEAKDQQPLNPEQLDIAADFIHGHLKHGNVYVHCRAGAGRSNMAIAAYLMKYCDYSVEEAKATIMGARRQSNLYKQEKLDALNVFEQSPKFQVMRKLYTQLKNQVSVLGNLDQELLLSARMADLKTELKPEVIDLIKTDSNDYYIKITIDGFLDYAKVSKKKPHTISVGIREPVPEENPSEKTLFTTLRQNPTFLSDLQTQVRDQIQNQYEKDVRRNGVTCQEDKKTPTALQSHDADKITTILKTLVPEYSSAYYLLLILLSQTALAAPTKLTQIFDDPESVGNSNEMASPKYVLSPTLDPIEGGDRYKIVKRGETIEVTAFLYLNWTVFDNPNEYEVPQGLLKVVHTTDVRNPQKPALSTQVTFIPRAIA